MKRQLASIAILGMVVAGCASLTPGTPANSPAQTWLAVHGPSDWIPPEPMSLEIGEAAWSITPPEGGGVVTPDLADPAEVRLVGVKSCREYAAFDITPGSAWIMRFAADGSVTVEDNAGGAREMGPGLVEGPRSNCESKAQSGVRMLPSTSPSPGLPSISTETPIPTPVPSADLVGVIHGAPDTEGGICPVILQDDAGERWEVYLGDAYSREYQGEVMVILGSDDEIIARSGDRVGFNITVDESLGSFCMAGIPVTATDIVFVQRPGN